MKKLASTILAIAMVLTMICTTAFAEEIPQPEGGKKFESNWAIFNVTVQIVYEEEGYRVLIRNWDPTELKGIEWEYSCVYNEEKDVLESFSSRKHTYILNPDTGEFTYNPAEYDDFDLDDNMTVFAINENGSLVWTDGRGQDNIDLEFTNIGNFEGAWRSEDENTWALIKWDDSEENYGYSVFMHSGNDDDCTEYVTFGLYIPDTYKLETEGTMRIIHKNESGEYDTQFDTLSEKLIFSDLGDGKILLEGEPAVELIYDIDMQIDFDQFITSLD